MQRQAAPYHTCCASSEKQGHRALLLLSTGNTVCMLCGSSRDLKICNATRLSNDTDLEELVKSAYTCAQRTMRKTSHTCLTFRVTRTMRAAGQLVMKPPMRQSATRLGSTMLAATHKAMFITITTNSPNRTMQASQPKNTYAAWPMQVWQKCHAASSVDLTWPAHECAEAQKVWNWRCRCADAVMLKLWTER